MFGSVLVITAVYSASVVGLGVYVTLPVFVVHTVVLPLAFRFCKTLQRKMVFLNAINWPLNTNFESPSQMGIEGARNLRIEHQSKVDHQTIEIGIWHIVPKSVLQRQRTELNETKDERGMNTIYEEELATSGNPIIMYCHGNSNSRAAKSRIKLYEVLQNMDFHIIAFDYRGYGDSSKVRPTELGVVEDTLVVYDWILNATQHSSTTPPVYIWGHSLGTAISSHLVGNLQELSTAYLEKTDSLPLPEGLILEAPFNNLVEEVSSHFMSKLVRWLPYYEAAFVRPISNSKDYQFTSDTHLTKVDNLPILILHAEDDYVVPYKLGVKLLKVVLSSRSDSGAPVGLRTFQRSLKLGHKWICMAEELPETIRNFMNGQVPESSQQLFQAAV